MMSFFTKKKAEQPTNPPVSEEDLRTLKRYIKSFYEERMNLPIHTMQITRVYAYSVGGVDPHIFLTIETGQKSQIIGVGGSKVAQLAAHLSGVMSRKVKINVISSTLWD